MRRLKITSALVARVERKVDELKRRGAVDASARLVRVAADGGEPGEVAFIYERTVVGGAVVGGAVVWRTVVWRARWRRGRIACEASLRAAGRPYLPLRAVWLDFELPLEDEDSGDEGNHLS